MVEVAEWGAADVVKIPRPLSEKGETPDEIVSRYIAAYTRGKGHGDFEQMSAYRLGDKPRVICRYIEAKNFESLTMPERSKATVIQYRNLFWAYAKMTSLEIEDDRSLRNLLYSPDRGFTIIDYEAAELADIRFTAEERIIGFATETLTHNVGSGRPVPEYIRIAHEAIVDHAGKDLGRIIVSRWKDKGLQIA